MRRTYTELDAKVKNVLEKFGKGASIREVANKSKINWRTTRIILEKFEKLGIAKSIFVNKRLKIYKILRMIK